jgi:hypothetical protein
VREHRNHVVQVTPATLRSLTFVHHHHVRLGQYVANALPFISVATPLATLNVIRTKDARGQEIVPEVTQSSGLVSHPKPFEYTLELRSKQSRALLDSLGCFGTC